MEERLRKTGIELVGDVPWGTHFCQFYKTKQDLLDFLVPYFRSGLENNEFCMWITAEPLDRKEAEKAMREAVPDFRRYVEQGQIEIIPYTEWYLEGGEFNSQRVLKGWVNKLDQALAKGYEGLRLTGNTFWLEKENWDAFTDYEEQVNSVIGRYRMIAICTYSLDKCGAGEVVDVIRNHQFALIKREGKWELIESTERKLMEEALKKSHERLEVLSDTASRLLMSDAPQRVIDSLCQKMLTYLDCQAFFNFLVDEDKQRLHLNAYGGIPEEAAREIEWLDFGAAVCGCAARDGCRIIAENIPETPDPRTDLVRSFGIKAYACHPLFSRGRVIGTLSFGTRSRISFTENELALMKTVADHVAIAIERIRQIESLKTAHEAVRKSRDELEVRVHERTSELKSANEKLVARARRQAAVAELGQRALAGVSLPELFAETLSVVAGALGVEYCRVSELLPSGNALMLRAGIGWKEGVVGQATVGTGTDSQAGYTLLSGEPVVVEDWRTEKRFGEPPLLQEHRVISGMSVTIHGAGRRPFGVLGADTRHQRKFTRDEVHFFQAVANVLSSAIARSEAEDALRRNESLLRAVLELLPVGVWVTDKDGRVTQGNPASQRIWGGARYVGPEQYGEYKGWWVSTGKPVQPSEWAAARAITNGETSIDEEIEIEGFDGTRKLILNSAVPIRNPEQEIVGAIIVNQDITDRKRAEEDLQRHAQMLDLAAETIMIFDLNGKIGYWNQGAANLYGWTRQEAIGQQIHTLLQTKFPYPVEEVEKTLFRVGHWEGELTHTRRDGTMLTVGSRWTLQRDKYGHPFAILEINHNITERKRAEKDLRAASLYFRSLLEASLDPLVTISADGKVMDVNRATEAVTGVSREQLIGSDFSDYFTEPERAREGYKQVFLEGAVRDYPLAIRHASGQVTDVLYNATVYRNEAGEVQGIFAAARDVTELKRTQEALKAASLYTRSLIEASLDPLVTISAGGKIMDVNRATEAVTGVSREQLIGSDFSDYFTEPEKAREGYRRVFLEGTVRDYPLAIRHRFGRVTDVLYNAAVYRNEAGEVQGVFAAARDITERKRAEEEVKLYTKKLEWSNRELQDFAFVASHDLQEPLRKIQSFGERLKTKYGSLVGEEGHDYLSRMLDAARRMQALIQALLNYSRVTTKAEPFSRVNLTRLVNEVVSDLETSVEETGAQVSIEDLETLEADPNQIRQLFQNLISNALKFRRDEKPVIKIYGRPINRASGEGMAAARYRIFVEDNGIGFEEKYLDRIFTPFQRLHGRGVYEGTGIGLAICRKIVERHHGSITAKSAPGKGSTFIITLPMEQLREGEGS